MEQVYTDLLIIKQHPWPHLTTFYFYFESNVVVKYSKKSCTFSPSSGGLLSHICSWTVKHNFDILCSSSSSLREKYTPLLSSPMLFSKCPLHLNELMSLLCSLFNIRDLTENISCRSFAGSSPECNCRWLMFLSIGCNEFLLNSSWPWT